MGISDDYTFDQSYDKGNRSGVSRGERGLMKIYILSFNPSPHRIKNTTKFELFQQL